MPAVHFPDNVADLRSQMVNYAFILLVNKPCFSFSPLNQLFRPLVWKNLPGNRPIIRYTFTILRLHWSICPLHWAFFDHHFKIWAISRLFINPLRLFTANSLKEFWIPGRKRDFLLGFPNSLWLLWIPVGFCQFLPAFVITCWVLWIPIGFFDFPPGIGISFRAFWFPSGFP